MRGIEHYQSADGFHVLRVHYTADPEKDPETPQGQAWLANELKGIVGGVASSQWRQEYEIDWDAAGGELVFPYFETFRGRIICSPFDVPESWSLFGSFDYGHRNPSSFHVYAIDHDSNIWAIWEFYSAGKGYRTIACAIRSCPYFERLSFSPIADPSIWAKTQQVNTDQNEMKSVAQLFFELPPNEQVIFAPGKSGGDITVAEKINGELWYVPDKPTPDFVFKPRLKIFSTCPFLIWEMGKLRYQDWGGAMQEMRNLQEKIVDKDNHAWDDLKMFMTMFFLAPSKSEDDNLSALRTLDPTSYNEWKSVQRMHGEEQSKGGVADFEEFEDDGYGGDES